MEQAGYDWRKWIPGPMIWQALLIYCAVSAAVMFTPLRKKVNWISPLVLAVNCLVLVRVYPRALTPGELRRKAVRFAQCIMIVAALFGALQRIASPEYVSGGIVYPYHFLRPFFDIVIPWSWAALLASPSMRIWSLESESRSSCDLRYSVADLLFFTAVTSFGMVLWLAFKTR